MYIILLYLSPMRGKAQTRGHDCRTIPIKLPLHAER